jgi:hypothetical protein
MIILIQESPLKQTTAFIRSIIGVYTRNTKVGGLYLNTITRRSGCLFNQQCFFFLLKTNVAKLEGFLWDNFLFNESKIRLKL